MERDSRMTNSPSKTVRWWGRERIVGQRPHNMARPNYQGLVFQGLTKFLGRRPMVGAVVEFPLTGAAAGERFPHTRLGGCAEQRIGLWIASSDADTHYWFAAVEASSRLVREFRVTCNGTAFDADAADVSGVSACAFKVCQSE